MIKHSTPRTHFGIGHAMQRVKDGLVVTREEWCDPQGLVCRSISLVDIKESAPPNYYRDGVRRLCQFRDGELIGHYWAGEEDLMATDWFVVSPEDLPEENL